MYIYLHDKKSLTCQLSALLVAFMSTGFDFSTFYTQKHQ